MMTSVKMLEPVIKRTQQTSALQRYKYKIKTKANPFAYWALQCPTTLGINIVLPREITFRPPGQSEMPLCGWQMGSSECCKSSDRFGKINGSAVRDNVQSIFARSFVDDFTYLLTDESIAKLTAVVSSHTIQSIPRYALIAHPGAFVNKHIEIHTSGVRFHSILSSH